LKGISCPQNFFCFLATIKWASLLHHLVPWSPPWCSALPWPESNGAKWPRIETSETMNQNKSFFLVNGFLRSLSQWQKKPD
jgi:hypothetical protein